MTENEKNMIAADALLNLYSQNFQRNTESSEMLLVAARHFGANEDEIFDAEKVAIAALPEAPEDVKKEVLAIAETLDMIIKRGYKIGSINGLIQISEIDKQFMGLSKVIYHERTMEQLFKIPARFSEILKELIPKAYSLPYKPL